MPLQSLFDRLSVSVLSTQPLPVKARRFVSDLFKGADGVPSQEWFDKYIPSDDPYGSTYYALLDLEKRARSYSPTAPKSVWDLLPLHLHIIMSFISGCAYYQQSIAHAVKCPGCEVCDRSDTFSTMLIKDPHFKAWNEMYGEEAMQEARNTDKRVQVPVVGKDDLEKVQRRLDGHVWQATPQPIVAQVKTSPLYQEHDESEDTLDWGSD